MTIKPFQALLPNLQMIASPDIFFDEVRQGFPEFVRSGFYNKNSQEAIYIYKYKSNLRTHLGLVACASLNDYTEGSILRHEHTLAQKEQKMMHVFLHRKAFIKPIMLTYPEVPKITKAMHRFIKKYPLPSMEIPFGGDMHEFWEVTDGQEIQKFLELFEEKVPKSYIADGHHRITTAVRLRERLLNNNIHTGASEMHDTLICGLFSDVELSVHDFNRTVDFSQDRSLTSIMASLSRKFEIKALKFAQKPPTNHFLTLYINREWYLLQWRAAILAKYTSPEALLDVSLLNNEVLIDIMGIEDVREDKRVKYVEGPLGVEGLKEKVDKGTNRLGFCLFPVELEELMRIADNGGVMPPKSTWFEPRIKSGFIAQGLDLDMPML